MTRAASRGLRSVLARVEWTPWALMAVVVMALALFIMVYPVPASGHSWYPPRCCSGTDCAHAINAIRNLDGSLTVTTKHGTATFPASFTHEPSPDGLIHACFSPWRLYCLFLSSGS